MTLKTKIILLSALLIGIAAAQTVVFNGSLNGVTNQKVTLPATGNSATLATSTGTQTSAAVVAIDSNGNHIASGCTINASTNLVTCPASALFGQSSGVSGLTLWTGASSGSSGFAVPAAAGTAILYLMPSTNGANGQFLEDTGTATCPAAPTDISVPATCHQMIWAVPSGSGTNVTTATIAAITTGNWATLGSGGCTRTNTTGPSGGGAIEMIGTSGGTGNICGVSIAAPGGDFTRTFVAWAGIPATGNGNVEAGFTDGTKVEGCGVDFSQSVTGTKTTALSAGTYTLANGLTFSGLPNPFSPGPVLIFQLNRSGTTLSCYVSANGGITYVSIFSDATPFLTASNIEISSDARGAASAPRFTLISYQ